jgi:Leucine-rich repeat (LRR) protein
MEDAKKKNMRQAKLESLDLQDLVFMKGISWGNLEEIFLSRNMINNIDTLSKFMNLRTIDASNNYIEEVVLFLPKLEKLDLSNNYLKKFPLLENGMDQLRILNLSQNRLVGIREVLTSFIPNIRTLDLGGNEIDFGNFNEFTEFVNKIREWRYLINLVVADNPFFLSQNIRRFDGKNVIEEMV